MNVFNNDNIIEMYKKLITVKKNKDITSYPFNISNEYQFIFTKKQIDLYYIKNYNLTEDSNIIGGGKNIKIFYY